MDSEGKKKVTIFFVGIWFCWYAKPYNKWKQSSMKNNKLTLHVQSAEDNVVSDETELRLGINF